MGKKGIFWANFLSAKLEEKKNSQVLKNSEIFVFQIFNA